MSLHVKHKVGGGGGGSVVVVAVGGGGGLCLSMWLTLILMRMFASLKHRNELSLCHHSIPFCPQCVVQYPNVRCTDPVCQD